MERDWNRTGRSTRAPALWEALDASLGGSIVCSLLDPERPAGPFVVEHVSVQAREMFADALELELPESVSGLDLYDVLPRGDGANLVEDVQAVAAHGKRTSGAIEVRGADGALAAGLDYAISRLSDGLILVSLQPNQHSSPQSPDYVELTRDALTGLANRASLRSKLLAAQRRLRDRGERFSVVFLDLDGLKSVNDNFGHPVGDTVLRSVAQRLRRMVRDEDMVARLGGDEFVLVVTGLDSEDEARGLHRRISSEIEAPLEVNGVSLRLSVSTGILLYPSVNADPEDLLRDADAAMYEAKAREPGSLSMFSVAQPPPVLGRLLTAGQLRGAVELGQLNLHYEPVVDAANGRPAGAEALLRWLHPQRGLLMCDEFMPVAEASEEYLSLGEYVISNVVAQVAAWDPLFDFEHYRIGMNISPRHLSHSDVAGLLASELESRHVSGDRLVVEIVESQALESRSNAARQIRALKHLGLRVAIDDFGSGFANMTYLRDLPVDMIKVDPGLIGESPSMREEAILRGIVSIAQAIGADVLLQGVVNSTQLDVANQAGVAFVQGPWIGPAAAPRGDSLPGA